MKSLYAALLCTAVLLHAQTVQSVFGSRQANTTADLVRVVPVSAYTWVAGDAAATIKFNADGSGKQSFFDFTWTVKDAQHIEIVTNESKKKTTLTFDNNYSSYTANDFDGNPIHGSIVAPKPTPAPVATPPLVASNPAATPAKTPSTSIAPPTPTPANASGQFFQSLQTGSGNYSSTFSSGGELVKALSDTTWGGFLGSRGGTVKLKADGTASSNFSSYKNLTWKVRSAHEIEVFITGMKNKTKVIMRFNSDVTKYTGTETENDYDYQFSGAKL